MAGHEEASPGGDDILDVDDVARLLRVPPSTVRYLARNGDLPGKKVGRLWRFRRSEIERWWAERDL